MEALASLRRALRVVRAEAGLVRELRAQVSARLLHAGVGTGTVLDMLSQLSKALGAVDPSGVLADAVTGPVLSHLRGRRDGVKCVVEAMTQPDHDLYAEFSQVKPVVKDSSGFGASDQERAAWVPASVDADPDAGSGGDMVTRIMDGFGSADVFVGEYRRVLAERLLRAPGWEADQGVETLERLRIRFGDEAMAQCRIMLKDVADSRRTAASLRPALEAARANWGRDSALDVVHELRPLLVSHHYWPALPGGSLRLRPEMEAALGAYAEAYKTVKSPRTVAWSRHLGSVTVEVALGDDPPREVVCSPLQATVLQWVSEAGEQRMGDLTAKTGVTAAATRRAVGFWVNEGVLSAEERTGSLWVFARRPSRSGNGADDDEECAAATGGAGRGATGDAGLLAEAAADDDEAEDAEAVEAAKVYEQFVRGMLTNFGQLPADRIHSMLSMFAAAAPTPYAKTPAQGRAMLAAMVRSGVLLKAADGQFKLA